MPRQALGAELHAGGGAGVVGVGFDLVDIRRIQRSIDRFGERFLSRIYTERERALCDARRANRIPAYARRWAAKEACAKALGTGYALGVAARQIELDRGEAGPPFLRLYGGAAARLAALTPERCAARLHVTMSDEPPYAAAVVVIDLRRLDGAAAAAE
ncbi:MAG: holo-ACP synthase [Pseudomonadota bacterium]